jgi:hypothetical protein
MSHGNGAPVDPSQRIEDVSDQSLISVESLEDRRGIF